MLQRQRWLLLLSDAAARHLSGRLLHLVEHLAYQAAALGLGNSGLEAVEVGGCSVHNALGELLSPGGGGELGKDVCSGGTQGEKRGEVICMLVVGSRESGVGEGGGRM